MFLSDSYKIHGVLPLINVGIHIHSIKSCIELHCDFSEGQELLCFHRGKAKVWSHVFSVVVKLDVSEWQSVSIFSCVLFEDIFLLLLLNLFTWTAGFIRLRLFDLLYWLFNDLFNLRLHLNLIFIKISYFCSSSSLPPLKVLYKE